MPAITPTPTTSPTRPSVTDHQAMRHGRLRFGRAPRGRPPPPPPPLDFEERAGGASTASTMRGVFTVLRRFAIVLARAYSRRWPRAKGGPIAGPYGGLQAAASMSPPALFR